VPLPHRREVPRRYPPSPRLTPGCTRPRHRRRSRPPRSLSPAQPVSPEYTDLGGQDTITGSYDDASQVLGQLAAAGIDFGDVTEFLERDGLAKFEKSWAELGATIAAELERQHRAPDGS
jgi:hypothetical protein